MQENSLRIGEKDRKRNKQREREGDKKNRKMKCRKTPEETGMTKQVRRREERS